MRFFPLFLSLCLARPAFSDDFAQRLRALSQKHTASVVTVALTISAEGDQRLELEAEGLVVDASGLVVTTNSAIDPFSLRPGTEGMVTNVTDAKVVLPGGREIAARLVLRDKTRNLAFLRPLKPLGLPALAFSASRAVAAQGETVVLVGRLGKAGGRVPSVDSVRLLAVMTRPRTLYVLPLSAAARLGEAAFNEKGQLLGMVSLRVAPSGRASFSETDRYVAAVMPCADIWAIARQVPPLGKSQAPKP